MLNKYWNSENQNQKIEINLIKFDSYGFHFKRHLISEKNLFELNSPKISKKVPCLEITITNIKDNNIINETYTIDNQKAKNKYSPIKMDYQDNVNKKVLSIINFNE